MKARTVGRISVKKIAVIALCAAALCVISPFSIPLAGMVPLSLATFAIYLFSQLFERRDVLLIVCLYLLIGVAGLPVFSGMSGGIGILFGARGGYLIAYVPLAYLSGLFRKNRLARALSMLLGTAVLYTIGTLWYLFVTGNAFLPSLFACVVPFLPGDALKIAAAIGIYEMLERRNIPALIRKF